MTGAPGRAVPAWMTAETLDLDCLYVRRGGVHVRLPVHRRQQPGACEWHAQRVGGRLVRIALTAERLEDWTTVAESAPEAIPDLYRRILGQPDIAAADLFWPDDVLARAGDGGYAPAFRRGAYNPLNVWNTIRGAVHATRRRAGMPRAGLCLTGLHILAPGGRDVAGEVLRATRRAPADGRVLRVEVAAPPGADYELDELLLPDGRPLTPAGLATFLDVVPEEDARAPRTLPGRLVAAAMLHLAQAGPAAPWPAAA